MRVDERLFSYMSSTNLTTSLPDVLTREIKARTELHPVGFEHLQLNRRNEGWDPRALGVDD